MKICKFLNALVQHTFIEWQIGKIITNILYFVYKKNQQNSLKNFDLLYFQAGGFLFVPHRVPKLACNDICCLHYVLLYRLEVFHLS